MSLSKSSLGSPADPIEEFVLRYRLLPTLTHLSAIAQAPDTSTKISLMVSLFHVHNNQTLLSNLAHLQANAPLVISFFESAYSFFQGLVSKSSSAPHAPPPPEETYYSADDLYDGLVAAQANIDFDVNPLLPPEEQEEPARSRLTWLTQHQPILRPILGGLAFLAATMGFNKLISSVAFAESVKNTITLCRYLQSKKYIAGEIDTIMDTAMSCFYSLFGEEYVTPKMSKIVDFNNKIYKLHAELINFTSRAKYDGLVLLRNLTVPSLEAQYKRYYAEVSTYSEAERTNFNFMDTIRECRKMLDALLDMRNTLLSTAGKQEPVRLWIAGPPGTGKSYVANRIANHLTPGSVYMRTCTEQYWSSYVGQGTVLFDDMLQNVNGYDESDYMSCTTTNSWQVNMPDLESKGRKFCSRYVIATSNRLAIRDPRVITSVEAFNRRRDLTITPVIEGYDTAKAEAKKMGSHELPRSFWENATIRYRVVRLDNPNDQEAPIITFEQLICLLKELELVKAEAHRLVLIEKTVGVNLPDPIQYDRAFDNPYYVFCHACGVEFFDIVNRSKTPMDQRIPAPRTHLCQKTAPFNLTPPRLALDREEQEQLSQDSVDGELSQQALCPTPHKVVKYSRRSAVILYGEPGIGKTHLIREFETEVGKQNFHSISLAEISDPNLTTKDYGGKYLFLDDFTMSESRIQAMRELVYACDNQTLRCSGLIATGNRYTPLLQGEVKHLIERRSKIFSLSLSTISKGAMAFHRQSVEEYLKTHPRDSYVKVYYTDQNGNNVDSVYPRAAYLIRKHLKDPTSDHEVHVDHAFVLPFPEDYDGIVHIPIDQDVALSPCDAVRLLTQIKAAWVDKTQTTVICDTPIPSFKNVSPTIFASVTKTLMHLVNTKAIGNNYESVASFNREAHEVYFPYTVVVCTNVATYCAVGVPIENSTNHVLTLFLIEDTDEHFNRVGNNFFLNGRVINFGPENSRYEQACRLTWPETPSVRAPPSEAEVMRTLVDMLPCVEFLRQACPIVHLLIAGFAGYNIVRWGVSSHSCEEKFQQERKHRGGAQLPPCESEFSDHDARRSPNKVRHEKKYHSRTFHDERKARAAKAAQLESEASDHGRKEPKNNVRAERKARGTIKQPLESECSDHGSKVKKNVVKERKARTQAPLQLESEHSDHGKQTSKNAIRPEIYDMRKRPSHNKIVPEINEDAQVVKHENGTFGVTYSGYVIYADEISHNNYTLTQAPITAKWATVEHLPTALSLRGRKWNHTYKTQPIQSSVVNAMMGQQIIFETKYERDFSSILATCLAFGAPIDIDDGILDVDIMPFVFNGERRFAAPFPLTQYLKSVHKQTFANWQPREHVQQEGMIDPNLPDKINQMMKACVPITSNGEFILYGILVGGNKLLTVGHVSQSHNPHITHIGKEWTLDFASRNQKCDLSVWQVREKEFPAQPRIAHMFISRDNMGALLSKRLVKILSALVIPARPGVPTANTHHCLMEAYCVADYDNMDGRTLSYKATFSSFGVTGVSVSGDCGSPLFVQDKTIDGKVIGIHRAGNSTCSQAACVTREFVESIYLDPESIHNFPLTQETITPTPTNPQIKMFEAARTCKRTGLQWVGKTVRSAYCPVTTRIHRTGIVIPEYDVYEPSMMDRKDPRASGAFDPINDGLARYGQRATLADPDLCDLREAMCNIGNELANLMLANNRQVHVLTKTEAVNTPSHYDYPNAKPIDRSGSAGFPHNTEKVVRKKGDFLYFNEKKQQWYFSDDSIVNSIEKLLQDARKGISHVVPFTAYTKDEPLKLKKIYETPKTRLFFSCPLEYLVAFRQYHLSSMCRIMELYHSTPVKVGISSQFHDWHVLTSQMLKVSQKGFASDVSNFDSSVPLEFLQESANIFNIIYSRCSAPGEKIGEGNQARLALHRSLEGAHVLSGNDLYKLGQAQVSGNPATAIENSFIMWALYYIVWKRLAKLHAPQLASYDAFRKCVALAIYGDDNVCTVRADCLEWFNFHTFQREAKTLGFNITDAAKVGGEAPAHQFLHEMEFLKRSFRTEQNQHMGPLALTSIAKSFMWIRDKSYKVSSAHVPSLGGEWPISANKELIETSCNALWGELSLHGKEIYEQWVSRLLPQAGALSLQLSPPRWVEAIAMMGYTMVNIEA